MPVALVVLGLVANGQLEGIKQQLKASERDIDVLMKFNQVYYGAESRVLSPHFVEVISSKTVRAHLRYFIFWDALNNNVSSDFKFDPSLRDWHTLGEVVQRHVWDSPDNELEFWKQAMKDSFDQWPQHKPELARLFDWVYRTYRLPDAFSLQPPGKNTQK